MNDSIILTAGAIVAFLFVLVVCALLEAWADNDK
jgi:hypothetical protein